MILLRSDASGSVFLVREGEERNAFANLRESFPGVPVELLQRGAGLLILRVAREGECVPCGELAIGHVELQRRRPARTG